MVVTCDWPLCQCVRWCPVSDFFLKNVGTHGVHEAICKESMRGE